MRFGASCPFASPVASSSPGAFDAWNAPWQPSRTTNDCVPVGSAVIGCLGAPIGGSDELRGGPLACPTATSGGVATVIVFGVRPGTKEGQFTRGATRLSGGWS